MTSEGPQPSTTSSAPVRQVRPPAPSSVSEEAQAYLSLPSFIDVMQKPALEDVEGWVKFIRARDLPVIDMFAPLMPPPEAVERGEIDADGVRTYTLRPVEADPDGPLFLELHGGALIQCGGDLAWMLAMPAALGRAGTTWVPDYRMPPRYPYPAALDDCIAVYKRALAERSPEQIVVSGGSAGGNLAAALLLRAKNEGLPMPAAVVLLTPELDLTESGDSFKTNNGIDLIVPFELENALYAAGADLAHPYLSPLFGDVTGFPPTFLQTGTRDLFLSNTVRMHRRLLKAGVSVELHVFEAMPHGSFGGSAPEDLELLAEVRRFEREHLGT
ncbi:alpha/beta hydrolase [Microbacterium invictum]|uniref:Alpha/beta hydrolase n=1 Tax=Microbacterium invictum TaxID=515415 RepID=A0ABZ0VCI2_9MICO|nr:alpha/beta hydrolase [Microbacterium invictum]WQB70502.1 alpha/beta hydrolase [Microbacterium invictum]